MWYNLTPADYARGLLFNAERCDEQAAHHRSEDKPWSPHEVARCERNAARLRAMAKLCAVTDAETAGRVDFLGMSCPSQTREEEARAIARADELYLAKFGAIKP